MEIPKEEGKKLGVPVAVFAVSLLAALVGGGALTYFYFPKIKTVERIITEPGPKQEASQSYSSDQYGYSFSYSGSLRLERQARAEGGYVKESIDLYEPSGKIRISVKVIAKKGVQCPYFSLDQFVHCAFLKWQGIASTPVTATGKQGIRLVGQGQLPPFDLQVATYFEKGDFVFEVDDFVAAASLDEDYNKILDSLNY